MDSRTPGDDLPPFAASPASAYRADMNGRAKPFGPDDDVWLAAASALRLAASLTGSPRRNCLFESLGVAIDLLGDERIDAYVEREWMGDRCYVESMVVLIEQIEQASAFRLAGTMLDDLGTAAEELSSLERGRILAIRARVDRKLGRLAEAVDRYAYVAGLGTETGLAELVVRSEIGLVAIAQVRGNLPELHLHASRAAALAERFGLNGLARLANHGLTIAGAKSGDYDTAVTAGWKLMLLSRGDPLLEAEALQNLGQLMLEFGQTALALSSFAAVMIRSAPAQILLPALGGLALASAHERNEATVEWSVREIWRAQESAVPMYELAAALLEAATALRLLTRHAEADRYRGASERIARKHGFHELVYRATDLAQPIKGAVASHFFLAKEHNVATALSALAPERLPPHVDFEAAPA